jgi:uncharacterized cupin superfamily protein
VVAIGFERKHLGVRIEVLAPGGHSSYHHFHTVEEHVSCWRTATLIRGTEAVTVKAGDHVWFPAGKEEAHHIENRSTKNFKFLVFGERSEADVVVYPDHGVMLVKALDRKQITYDERTKLE